MTIARATFLYELLVRLGPYGFIGAHAIDLERVSDGAEIIAERELPARPLTEAEAGAILGAESARLIEQLGAAAVEAAALRERIAVLEAEAVDAAAAKAADAATIAALAAQGALADARAELLETENAGLRTAA